VLDELEAFEIFAEKSQVKLTGTALGAPGFRWDEVAATVQENDRFGR
jgi:hypothetical protein